MRQGTQTQQKWRAAIFAQKDSGLLPGEYCRRKGLCKTSFYTWRKRLGMARDAAGPQKMEPRGFIRLKPPAASVPLTLGPTPFAGAPVPLAVEAVDPLSAMRIETPNGYCVQSAYGGVGGLKRVLELLRCL